jgi:hypothetical protein
MPASTVAETVQESVAQSQGKAGTNKSRRSYDPQLNSNGL